jgi:hemerythrin
MPIVWSKSYSIGVDEIDSQHKKLILLINRLEVLSTMNPTKPEYNHSVTELIFELVNYTVLHFATEEVLMSMFEYPGCESHKKSHEKFVQLVSSKKINLEYLIAQKDYEKIQAELLDIFNFLENWLISHILKSDAEYTEFFLAIKKKAKKSGGWFSFLSK